MALYNLYEGIVMLSMLTKPTDLRNVLLGDSRGQADSNLKAVTVDGKIDKDKFNLKFEKNIRDYLAAAGFAEEAYGEFSLMFYEVLRGYSVMFDFQAILEKIDQEYSGTGQHPDAPTQRLMLRAAQLMDDIAINAMDKRRDLRARTET